MFTMLILWLLDVQFPDWTIPVAAVIGFAAIFAAVKTTKKD